MVTFSSPLFFFKTYFLAVFFWDAQLHVGPHFSETQFFLHYFYPCYSENFLGCFQGHQLCCCFPISLCLFNEHFIYHVILSQFFFYLFMLVWYICGCVYAHTHRGQWLTRLSQLLFTLFLRQALLSEEPWAHQFFQTGQDLVVACPVLWLQMCAWYFLWVSEIQTHFLMLVWQAFCVYTKLFFVCVWVCMWCSCVCVCTYMFEGQRLMWVFSLFFETGSLTVHIILLCIMDSGF